MINQDRPWIGPNGEGSARERVLVIANRKDLTLEQMKIILTDEDPGVRIKLAMNKTIPEEIQLILMADQDSRVGTALAKNESLTKKVELALTKHGSMGVRAALAGNKRINEDIQKILLQDEQSSVLYALACNPSVTEAVQCSLAEVQNVFVQSALAIRAHLQLKTAVILYYSAAEKKVLEWMMEYNQGLYQEILTLEQELLKENRLSFLNLVNQKGAAAKKEILLNIIKGHKGFTKAERGVK